VVTIVTGWSPSGWTQYAQRFMQSVRENWQDPEVRWVAYVEENRPELDWVEQINVTLLLDLMKFLAAYGNDSYATGRMQKPGFAWKAKLANAGYNFRFDAVKFARIPFYVRHQAKRIGHGIVVWMDADCVVFKEVPEGFVPSLLPKKACVAYLGRVGGYHSECGFTAFKLPEAKRLTEDWAAMYESGLVCTLREWHNSFVFDHCRQILEKTGMNCHNMTPKGKRHCWVNSPLGAYIDHLKGDKRKEKGFSPERHTPEKPRKSKIIRPNPTLRIGGRNK